MTIIIEPPAKWKTIERGEFANLTKLLEGYGGCYVLKDVIGTVLYVGKSRLLHQRIRDHARGHSNTREFAKEIESVDVYVVNDDYERNVYEHYLINSLIPLYNKDEYLSKKRRKSTAHDDAKYARADKIRDIKEEIAEIKDELEDVQENDYDYAIYDEVYRDGLVMRLDLGLVEKYDELRKLGGINS